MRPTARRPRSKLFLILAMIAQEGIPAQTVAPKFTGRFNKGVDYVGDLARFEKEFGEDLCVLAFAAREFGLPPSLKLSVHSGSDKFSLYPIINRLLKKHDAGVHVKTAGTTWLEEVIGLAESGGEGLVIAKDIYEGAFMRYDELTKPYASVIDIRRDELPAPDTVQGWDAAMYARHAAPRGVAPRLQPELPATRSRRLQGSRRDGPPLHPMRSKRTSRPSPAT